MKNNLLKAVVIAAGFMSVVSFANATGTTPAPSNGNFYGNQNGNYYGDQRMAGLNSVSAIKTSKMYLDDVPVSLTGTLGQQIGHEHYNFTDSTGSITVEIDSDKLWGQQIGPQTKVIIYGEVDHEGYGLKVDVDVIRVVR